ncbi:PPR domain protein [Medicago truncatula]|uniref:PPR domain protein n=1 Tax=Medicago truncatula TaxID=3880 RepID=G7ILR8_MEDTR|nr:PPR domain protein [Medicago truncatula]
MEQLRSDGRKKESERVLVVEEREREHGGELVGEERVKKVRIRSSIGIENDNVELLRASASCDKAGHYEILSMAIRVTHNMQLRSMSFFRFFAHICLSEEAMEVFELMLLSHVEPNEVTLIAVVSACSEMGNLEMEKERIGTTTATISLD